MKISQGSRYISTRLGDVIITKILDFSTKNGMSFIMNTNHSYSIQYEQPHSFSNLEFYYGYIVAKKD